MRRIVAKEKNEDLTFDLKHFVLLDSNIQIFEMNIRLEVTRLHDTHDLLVTIQWLDDRLFRDESSLSRIERLQRALPFD